MSVSLTLYTSTHTHSVWEWVLLILTLDESESHSYSTLYEIYLIRISHSYCDMSVRLPLDESESHSNAFYMKVKNAYIYASKTHESEQCLTQTHSIRRWDISYSYISFILWHECETPSGWEWVSLIRILHGSEIYHTHISHSYCDMSVKLTFDECESHSIWGYSHSFCMRVSLTHTLTLDESESHSYSTLYESEIYHTHAYISFILWHASGTHSRWERISLILTLNESETWLSHVVESHMLHSSRADEHARVYVCVFVYSHTHTQIWIWLKSGADDLRPLGWLLMTTWKDGCVVGWCLCATGCSAGCCSRRYRVQCWLLQPDISGWLCGMRCLASCCIYMCVCVCVCVCLYEYMCKYAWEVPRVQLYIHVRVCVHMYIQVYIQKLRQPPAVCTCACMCVCAYM